MKKILALTFILAAIPVFSQTQVAGMGGTLKLDKKTGIVSATIPLTNINGVAVDTGNAKVTLPAVAIGSLENGGCLVTGGVFDISAKAPGKYAYDATFTGPNTKECPQGEVFGGTWQTSNGGDFISGDYYLLAFATTDSYGNTAACIIETYPLTEEWNGSAPVYLLSCEVK